MAQIIADRLPVTLSAVYPMMLGAKVQVWVQVKNAREPVPEVCFSGILHGSFLVALSHQMMVAT